MNHLKPHRNGFRFRTGDTGHVVEISVSYDKGGPNYFTGGHGRRGVHIFIGPLEITEEGYQRITLTHGIRGLALPLERLNTKRVLEVAERIDSIVPAIAAEYTEANKRESLLKLIGVVREVAAEGVKA